MTSVMPQGVEHANAQNPPIRKWPLALRKTHEVPLSRKSVINFVHHDKTRRIASRLVPRCARRGGSSGRHAGPVFLRS